MGMLILCSLALSACADYPRDIEATEQHVRSSHIVRVGMIEGDRRARHAIAIDEYLAGVERAVGARRVLTSGTAENLFAALDANELDLVVGEFASDTPWLTEVTIIEPIAERSEGSRSFQLSPVARNGENRWIMTLEKVARDLHRS